MKNNKIKIIIIFAVLSSFLLIGQKVIHASKKGKTVLVHFVANIKKNDGPPCVAFDMAYTNLIMGNKVEMLFDADAAWNLKLFEKDNKNDYDRYDIPADLKALLNQQFKDPNINKLKTFGDFLSYMEKIGAELYVNGTWNVLTSVEKKIKGKEKMPNYATPLTLKEMAEVINSADSYMRY